MPVSMRQIRHFMTKTWAWEEKLPTFIELRKTAALGVVLALSTAAGAQNQSSPQPQDNSAKTMAAPAAQPQTGASGKRAQSYYHFALGHLYEHSAEEYGRPDLANQAIEQYKLALSNDPDSVFLQTNLAQTYFKLGRIREAIETAQQVLKNHPDDLEAHKLLGRVYLRSLGDGASGHQSGTMLELAIQEFQKIVSLEPNSVDDHLLLGQLYTLKHDSAAAKIQFEAANRIDPESEDVVLNLARLYGEQGDMKKTVSVLERIPQGQRSPKINLALGAAYDQLKEPKLAIPAYQAALDGQPDNMDAQRGLAEDLLSTGQPNAALKIYQGITTQDPEDAHSLVRLSELERAQGNLDKAKDALSHARDIDPNSIEVQYNEAMIDEAQGDLTQAAAILNKLAQSTQPTNGKYSADEKNNHAIFLDRLATVYRDENKTDQAIAAYKAMIALGGVNAERGYQGEVDTYRDAKMLPQATAAAQQAVGALPKNVDLQLTLAGQLADTGKAREGLTLAKAQLNGSDQDRVVWLTLTQMNTRLHKWKDAATNIDQAEKLSHSNQEKALIHFLRGALQERQKHVDAAEREFRQALALDPNNALALNYLGYMLADHNLKLNEALQLVQRAVKLDPENGAYLDSLGWVHYKLGQYGMAEQVLQKAITLIPTDPTVHDHLGEVYATTGHLQQAVAQWESSLANYSNSAPADAEPADVNKVRKRLDKARVKLAKEDAHATSSRQQP